MIKQIGLPLRGRPILLITSMITDRIGLHSVLLPILIERLVQSFYYPGPVFLLSMPFMEPDSLSFLTLITKLQSHSVLGVEFLDFEQTQCLTNSDS